MSEIIIKMLVINFCCGYHPLTGDGDDDEYVPPKLEIQEIKEDDAIYSKR